MGRGNAISGEQRSSERQRSPAPRAGAVTSAAAVAAAWSVTPDSEMSESSISSEIPPGNVGMHQGRRPSHPRVRRGARQVRVQRSGAA